MTAPALTPDRLAQMRSQFDSWRAMWDRTRNRPTDGEPGYAVAESEADALLAAAERLGPLETAARNLLDAKARADQVNAVRSRAGSRTLARSARFSISELAAFAGLRKTLGDEP